MGPKNRATNWHYIRFGTISDGTITGMHCISERGRGLLSNVSRCECKNASPHMDAIVSALAVPRWLLCTRQASMQASALVNGGMVKAEPGAEG